MSGANVLQVGKHGAVWELEAPHTVETVRDDAQRSEEPRGWRCRRGRHDREVIGRPYVPEDDWMTAALNLLAASDVRVLTRCKRYGTIQQRAY